jgi:hypothetical protein
VSDIPAYLGRTLNSRASDTALEISQIVREVMNRLASKGQTGASIKYIDREAIDLLTKKINEACQFSFSLMGNISPEVLQQVTYFAGRVEKIISDEVQPAAVRLGIRPDHAAQVNATFLDQLRSRKEQLLDDFSHGMQGSERLKKDPVVHAVINQSHSPGAVAQVGAGTFSQSAFTQQQRQLIEVIDQAINSAEFAALDPEKQQSFRNISDAVKAEASSAKPDTAKLQWWGKTLVAFASDVGMRVASSTIAQVLVKIFT